MLCQVTAVELEQCPSVTAEKEAAWWQKEEKTSLTMQEQFRTQENFFYTCIEQESRAAKGKEVVWGRKQRKRKW